MLTVSDAGKPSGTVSGCAARMSERYRYEAEESTWSIVSGSGTAARTTVVDDTGIAPV